MEKNINILNYIETYKKKHHIAYLDENGKLYKWLKKLFIIPWVYSLVVMLAMLFGWLQKMTASDEKYRAYYIDTARPMFIVTLIIVLLMIAAIILFKFKKDYIAIDTAIVSQIALLLAYEPRAYYGMGYRANFYWTMLIPSILVMLFALFMLGIRLYSVYRKNRLYKEIIDNLYRQYGVKDGKKLSDAEWNEFLDNYGNQSHEEKSE